MFSTKRSTFGHWGFSMKYKSDIILSNTTNMSGPSPSKKYVAFLKTEPPSLTPATSYLIMSSLNRLFSINKVRKAYAELFALVIPEQSQPEHGDIMVAQSTAICSILKL